MRTLIILIILFFNINIKSQNKRFIYEYTYIPDSTQFESKKSELMFLDVGLEKSEYYGLEKFTVDSSMLDNHNKGLFAMPPNKDYINYRITKSRSNNKITSIQPLIGSNFFVEENPWNEWKLVNEKSTFLNYEVQKAMANFGGRIWIAWFTYEIPLQDGPYKFSGLPGLIVKIYDSSKSHSWELKGVKVLSDDFTYPDTTGFINKNITVNAEKYSQIYKAYRKDPVGHLVGKIPASWLDENGNVVDGKQKFREIEQLQKERLSKDNNIIEIDLLNKL